MRKMILKEINKIAYNSDNAELYVECLPVDSAVKAQCLYNKTTDENLRNLIKDFRLLNKGQEPKYSDMGQDFQYIKMSYSSRVKSFFESINNPILLEVVSVLKELSPNSCMVGGSVRDIIMYKGPKDFDFVTDVDYDILVKAFKERNFSIKEVGKQFLVLIVSKDGQDFEISNFRKDGTYTDGRRSESVEVGTIFDDAQRRDFTINALYFNLNTRKLLDPNLAGILDIKNKVLKFIGNPEDRIKEDKLRVMRFYRFLDSTNFSADKNSLKAVRKNFENMLKETSSERIKSEVEKMIGVV